MAFSLEKAILWIEDSSEVKNVLMDLLWTSSGLHVDYCIFISCLDSHSDGTHSLHRIHRWVMLNFLWRNKLVYILGVSEFSSNFNFCVSFKSVTLQHEETQEQPEIPLTLTRFQQLHISTTPLLQPVQVTAADGNPICSRAIQQSTTTSKPRGRPRRYTSSASGATHRGEPVTFRPATHTAPTKGPSRWTSKPSS